MWRLNSNEATLYLDREEARWVVHQGRARKSLVAHGAFAFDSKGASSDAVFPELPRLPNAPWRFLISGVDCHAMVLPLPKALSGEQERSAWGAIQLAEQFGIDASSHEMRAIATNRSSQLFLCAMPRMALRQVERLSAANNLRVRSIVPLAVETYNSLRVVTRGREAWIVSIERETSFIACVAGDRILSAGFRRVCPSEDELPSFLAQEAIRSGLDRVPSDAVSWRASSAVLPSGVGTRDCRWADLFRALD